MELKITQVIGKPIAVLDIDGRKVYERLVEAYKNHEKVILSFKGLQHVTTAFLNAAIGRFILGAEKPEDAKNMIKIEDLENESTLHKIKQVYQLALSPQLRQIREERGTKKWVSMNKYLIKDIRNEEPGNRLYFFDANVWLFIIDRSLEPMYHEQIYVDFWDKLTSAGAKKVIVANSLLISEILNTYLRLKFESYKEEQITYNNKTRQQVNGWSFKKDYRGSLDYRTNLVSFISEFSAYSYFIEIINDKAEEVDIIEMLNDMPANSDFNDAYYYRFCKINGFPIVTHDADFRLKDVEILTCNKNLLAIKS